ncbi:MAG: glycosyltransferase family 39 protein, partial [Desulfobulbaceae bacterium]|nr:glycosyltransferase family 39 protein [Desulfobulbaceae bacterium]
LSFPHDKNSLSFSKGTEKPWALTLLVLVATAIRLYSLSVTEIINPDGTLYINQARAIAMGDWSAVFTIHPYLSNYSILIRIFHLVIPEWLLAAHAVSIAFGSLAMIPLYGLFRQFFRHDESLATTTALAFLPTWVFNSIDIVRDPVSWFFSLYGLYWLIKGLKNNKKYLLPISCLAFLFAAWARIEALIYPTACLMLPVFFQRYRKNFFWFYLPILAGLAILFLLPVIDKDLLLKVSRVDSFINTIIKIITSGLPQYTEIRKAIPSIISPDQGKLIFSFLAEARSFIWLIALGVVGNRLFEAFSYPYTLIALFGITIFIRNSKDRALSIFLILLPFAALTALYIRTFQVWVIEYRYMMLVILPGSLCFCAGISSLSTKIEKRFGCSRLIALTSLTLL